MNYFALTLAGIAIMPPTLLWLVRPAPSPPPAFLERFTGSVVDVALAKPDQSALPVVRRVRTETLLAEPEPPIVVATEPAEPITARPGHARVRVMYRARDICARHNMRKVITRGGRSWRCRKF